MAYVDESGVTTLTNEIKNYIQSYILDSRYPIGSIYLSINNTNPTTLFGGTWEQIQDRFLLAAGSTYIAGSTGGEAEHTLDIQEMPKHVHDVGAFKDGGSYNAYGSDNYGASVIKRSNGGKISSTWVNTALNTYGTMFSIGGVEIGTGDPVGLTSWAGNSQPHNNMPPYLVVYMWRRIG